MIDLLDDGWLDIADKVSCDPEHDRLMQCLLDDDIELKIDEYLENKEG